MVDEVIELDPVSVSLPLRESPSCVVYLNWTLRSTSALTWAIVVFNWSFVQVRLHVGRVELHGVDPVFLLSWRCEFLWLTLHSTFFSLAENHFRYNFDVLHFLLVPDVAYLFIDFLDCLSFCEVHLLMKLDFPLLRGDPLINSSAYSTVLLLDKSLRWFSFVLDTFGCAQWTRISLRAKSYFSIWTFTFKSISGIGD